MSHKALVMQQYCQQHRPDIIVVVPMLPSFPAQAALHLLSVVEQYRAQSRIGLVGSSLGGFLCSLFYSYF
ncbi:YqiA/YcfP family alpha/beta fold hydrolase, partial [Vibrio cholerae]|uniref:YqiA/YcfP family alpha/beta fold hydrolase n=1 Tax=Vibrio cholerae TaxID=666 RepID=UPI0023DFA5A6